MKQNSERNKIEFDEINSILDKMVDIRIGKSNDIPFGKKVLYLFGFVAGIILIVFLCIMMYKNNFSTESLFSLLLAFFSIFISIFFYFKASDTSSDFYKSSYDFMKEVSVTLGKIEERFGEKLNSINEKMSNISEQKKEKTEELETVSDEKQKIIDDLLEKSQIDEQEKETFREALQKKENERLLLENEISYLSRKQQQYELDMVLENRYDLKNKFNDNGVYKFFDGLNKNEKKHILMETSIAELQKYLRGIGFDLSKSEVSLLRTELVNKYRLIL